MKNRLCSPIPSHHHHCHLKTTDTRSLPAPSAAAAPPPASPPASPAAAAAGTRRHRHLAITAAFITSEPHKPSVFTYFMSRTSQVTEEAFSHCSPRLPDKPSPRALAEARSWCGEATGPVMDRTRAVLPPSYPETQPHTRTSAEELCGEHLPALGWPRGPRLQAGPLWPQLDRPSQVLMAGPLPSG